MSANKETADINHIDGLLGNLKRILEDPELSDVTLIVEGCEFPAHKVVLAAQSDYFKALLFGGLEESSKKEIELKDASKESFKVLLEYIYTGCMSITDVQIDLILEVLELCNKWSFTKLQAAISINLKKILSAENVWKIYDISKTYSIKELSRSCLNFVDRNALAVMEHSSFVELPAKLLSDLISRDSFMAPEKAIFQRLCSWILRHGEMEPGVKEVLENIRWPLISLPDFLEIFAAADFQNGGSVIGSILRLVSNSKHRGLATAQGENVLLVKFGASVVRPYYGASDSVFGDSQRKSFISHTLPYIGDQAIVIKLGEQYLLGHLRMLLWNEGHETRYSYYIEVSVDQISWIRVIDYRQSRCYGMQNLQFPTQGVRYIKIVCTGGHCSHAPVGEFKIKLLEAFQKARVNLNFEFGPSSGIMVLKDNIFNSNSPWAHIKTRHVDHALTCKTAEPHRWHWRPKSNNMMVALPQPCIIDSMRIFVYDQRSTDECYEVEVSTNEVDWKTLGVFAFSSAWRISAFEPLSIVFIRLSRASGFYSSTVCVNLECPSTVAEQGDDSIEATLKTEQPSSSATV